MIPRKLHMIWIGDEAKRPDAWIATWREKHPSWEFKLWGNAELAGHKWRLRDHMERLTEQRLWSGVADLMRYEILFNEGGVYADADSECFEPFDELLSYEAFAAFEHENAVPGLICNSVIGAAPGNAALGNLIDEIAARQTPCLVEARILPVWQSIGPVAFTKAIAGEEDAPSNFLILPSCAFYPVHHTGRISPAKGTTYCTQHWATTRCLY